ncbi:MAG: LytR/AlgR family response regulator transcription factor [Gammaproteobacteria bacterium]
MRILIADDEAPARARLRRLIGELGVGEIVGESATGRETLAAVETTRPDLVLLDIRMPEGDGLAVARGLVRLEPPPALVFVTALADRALAALEAGAAAYLVKPASREALASAIARARRPSRAQLEVLPQDQGARRHVAVRVGRELRLVPVADFRYFRVKDKTTIASFAGGEAVLEDSLAALEREFAPDLLRIRRNLLVPRTAITRIVQTEDGSFVLLTSGERLPVARRHRRALAAALETN